VAGGPASGEDALVEEGLTAPEQPSAGAIRRKGDGLGGAVQNHAEPRDNPRSAPLIFGMNGWTSPKAEYKKEQQREGKGDINGGDFKLSNSPE